MVKYVSVLGVLAEATQYIGSEQYAICSAVLPLASFLHRLLEVHDDDRGYIARFKTASVNDFTRRVEDIDALPTSQIHVTRNSHVWQEKNMKQC